jgi:hypothetical protein
MIVEEIRKALKAMDLIKILEGKQALGNKSNTKDIGEHKVRPLSVHAFVGSNPYPVLVVLENSTSPTNP